MKQKKWGLMSVTAVGLAISAIIFPMLIDKINESKYATKFDIQLPHPKVKFLQNFSNVILSSTKTAESQSNGNIHQGASKPADIPNLDNLTTAPPSNINSADLLNFNQDMGSVWVVQVGSFANISNATKLESTLQKLHYHSYYKQELTPNGLLYKVYIGPIIDYGIAESTNTQIGQKLALKGTVKYYEPL